MESITWGDLESAISSNSAEAAGWLGLGLGVVIFFLLFSIVLLVVEIILINKLVKKVQQANGLPINSAGETALICLVPFYNWYWVYTRSQKLVAKAKETNPNASDNTILYLILAILITPIISWILMYMDAKKIIESGNSNNGTYVQQ